MRHQYRMPGVGLFFVGQDAQLRRGDDHFRILARRSAMNPHVAGEIDLLALAAHVAIISAHGDGRFLRTLMNENGQAQFGAVVVRIMADFRRFQRVG